MIVIVNYVRNHLLKYFFQQVEMKKKRFILN